MSTTADRQVKDPRGTPSAVSDVDLETEPRPLASLLSRRLVLAHLALLVLLTTLASAIEYRVLHHRTRRELTQVAQRFAPSARSALPSDPNKALPALTRALGGHPGVALVEVLDGRGRSVAFWQGDQPPSMELRVDAPLARPGEPSQGTLRLASSESWILASLLETILKTASALVPLLGCQLLLMAYLARRHVSRPLAALSQQMTALAAKEAPGPVDWPSTETAEFTQLQMALNRLLQRISRDRARVTHQKVHLEAELATQTREATAKDRWFSSLFDRTHAGILILDRDLCIVECNAAFAQLAGGTPPLLLGRQFDTLTPPEDRSLETSLLQETLQGQRLHYRREKRVLRLDGQMRWVDHALAAIQDPTGQVINLLALVVDITTRKQGEEALLKATQAAQQASRAKGEFLANMSHEIRTPMNGILGMTDLTLRTELSARQREYLLKIRTSGRNLLGILNDVLDFSKVEAGQLDLESTEFRLASVLESVDDLLGPTALGKGLELIFIVDRDLPEQLVGDPLRLGQVLINLAGNAVKFTEKGEVVIRVALDPEQPDQLLLSVRDTGIGIPPDKLPRLFEPFTQADTSTTRRFGGTGLGLAISRRLVEAMGGQLRAESWPGQGSHFSFTLPLVSRNRPPVRPEAPAHLKGLGILVVDDQADFRNLLCRILDGMGFSAVAAEHGDAALALLREARPEGPFRLALVDWRMPGMDGLELSAAIRADARLAHLPIVLMTGYGRETAMVGAERLGIEACLLKPIMPNTLFDTIVEIFAPGAEPAHLQASAAPAAPAAVRPLEGGRILLVEDNDINRDVALGLMADLGLDIRLALNGREAVEAVWDQPFDAVLMDIQMPVLDGLEATRLIRGEHRFAKLPIIAMTAHAMKGDRERCLAAGMTDYLSKPLDATELIQVLQRWVWPTPPAPESPGLPPAPPATPPHPAGELPETLPGLDLPEALRRLMGSRDILLKMLLAFRTDYAGVLDQLRTLLADGHREEARRLAHTLKGLAGQMAAAPLRQAALDLETALQAGGPGDVEPCVVALEHELAPVLAGLQHLDAAPSTPEPAPAQATALAPCLKALDTALRHQDFEARHLLETLEATLPGEPHRQALAPLREALDRFEFKAARKVLLSLAQSLGHPLETQP